MDSLHAPFQQSGTGNLDLLAGQQCALQFIRRAQSEHRGVACITFGSMLGPDMALLQPQQAVVLLYVLCQACLHHDVDVLLLCGDDGIADGVQQRLRAVLTQTEVDARAVLQKPSASPASTLIIRSYVPYSAVFPHCRLVIHHGGAGSTSEAIRYTAHCTRCSAAPLDCISLHFPHVYARYICAGTVWRSWWCPCRLTSHAGLIECAGLDLVRRCHLWLTMYDINHRYSAYSMVRREVILVAVPPRQRSNANWIQHLTVHT